MVLNLLGKLPFLMNFKTKLPQFFVLLKSLKNPHLNIMFIEETILALFLVSIFPTESVCCHFKKFEEFANIFLRLPFLILRLPQKGNLPQVMKHCSNAFKLYLIFFLQFLSRLMRSTLI